MAIATGTVLLAAAAAMAGAGATVYAAETAKKGQKQALRQQEKAQNEATRMAASEREMAGMERRRMEGKTPDVAALLTGEQGAQGRGAASTLLTGNTRIGDQMDRIGKNTLLGE
jgi:hypothetical protein